MGDGRLIQHGFEIHSRRRSVDEGKGNFLVQLYPVYTPYSHGNQVSRDNCPLIEAMSPINPGVTKILNEEVVVVV